MLFPLASGNGDKQGGAVRVLAATVADHESLYSRLRFGGV